MASLAEDIKEQGIWENNSQGRQEQIHSRQALEGIWIYTNVFQATRQITDTHLIWWGRPEAAALIMLNKHT